MNIDPDPEQDMIGFLLDNNDVFREMLNQPDRVNMAIVETRREEYFSFMWRHMDFTQAEALDTIESMEAIYIEHVGDLDGVDLPEWLLRMQAHDRIIEFLHNEMLEE